MVVGWSGGIGVKYPQSFDGRTTGMGDDFFILRIFASLGIDIYNCLNTAHSCLFSVSRTFVFGSNSQEDTVYLMANCELVSNVLVLQCFEKPRSFLDKNK